MHEACFELEDIYGFRPSFTVANDARSFRTIAGAMDASPRLTIDHCALNVFFRTGLFLNGSTPFVEVRRVEREPVIVAPHPIEYRAALHTFVDLFRESVQRRLDGDCVVALSGGRDSRHILLQLYECGRLPTAAITVDIPARKGETLIARQLAARLGIRHVILYPRPNRVVEDESYKNLATNFLTLEHGWMADAARSELKGDWWDGIAGDIMSAGLFLTPVMQQLAEQHRLDELAEQVVLYSLPHFLWQSTFSRDDALHLVARELHKHMGAANPIGSFYFWNRTRVAVAACPFGLLENSNRQIVAPFLDSNLWHFLASLPADMLVSRRFHSDAIDLAFPGFSDIPYFASSGYRPSMVTHSLHALASARAVTVRSRLWKFPFLARLGYSIVDIAHPAQLPHLLATAIYYDQLQSIIESKTRTCA